MQAQIQCCNKLFCTDWHTYFFPWHFPSECGITHGFLLLCLEGWVPRIDKGWGESAYTRNRTVRMAPTSLSPRYNLSNPCYGSQVQSQHPAFLPRAGERGVEEIYWVTEKAWGSQTLLIVKGSSNFYPSELGAEGNWDSDRCLSNTGCSRLGLWLPAALA